MKKKVNILGLSYSHSQIGSYVLILSEEDENGKKIPIIINSNEAQKIALQSQNIKPLKSDIYDTLKMMVDTFNIGIRAIYIYKLLEGTFYTKIVTDEKIEIECSVGDGVALSTIFDCPIYVNQEILDQVGVHIDHTGNVVRDENDIKETPTDIIDIDDLEKMLQKAIENEDYEEAAKLRDRIKDLN